MREKVTFTYKDGFSKTKFKNVSDKHLEILKRDICKEQIRRKESQMFGKSEKYGFKKKLKRFIRRLGAKAEYKIDAVVVNCIVGSEQACKSPYIGMIDEVR